MQPEAVFRLGSFLGVLLVMAAWQRFAPRRIPTQATARRWSHNLGLVVLDTILLRLLVPATAIGAAVLANERQWGLFNRANLPEWADVILAVALLDLVIYLQHVAFHAVPVLWRLHKVHHTDLDYDTTTGVRFHPIEIILSAGIKMAAVLLLGAPALSVLIFEVLLNATALFNHGNVRIPSPVDRVLRWIVVTPDMHRVHHSVIRKETDSNYGFNLPWWDRMFRTYRDQPADGHRGMTIGLEAYRDASRLTLARLLALPFR